MFCKLCGKEIAPDSVFCSYCGARQEDGEPQPDAVDRWETCEVNFTRTGGWSEKHEWVAVVTAPTGTSYIHEPSHEAIVLDRYNSPHRGALRTHKAHASLVQLLVREGWEPVGVGEHWWQHRFRRPVRVREWETCEIVYRAKRWYADAIGQEGQYVTDQSERLSWLRDKTDSVEGRAAHRELLSRLISEDWETVDERGSEWWELRLRRRISAP